MVGSKASGRLLPVFCDGLPQLAQHPTSVRTQWAGTLATVSHAGTGEDIKPLYLSLRLFRSSLVTSLRTSFNAYSSLSI